MVLRIGEEVGWQTGNFLRISGWGPREGQACNQNYLLVGSKHFSQEVFGHNAVDRAFRWRKKTYQECLSETTRLHRLNDFMAQAITQSLGTFSPDRP